MFEHFAANNSVRGIARDMLLVLKEALGFDWQYVWADDMGIKNESTGKWTGVAQMLIDGVS